MKDEAKGVFEATRTPVEKFRAEVDKLGALKAGGFIESVDFLNPAALAAGTAAGNALAAMKIEPGGKINRASIAARWRKARRSARSAILEFRAQGRGPGGDPSKQVADNTRKIVAESETTNVFLGQLVANMVNAKNRVIDEAFGLVF